MNGAGGAATIQSEQLTIKPPLDFFDILEEDGGGCVFEDRVGKGIAESDLLADFLVELVGGAFGFPVAVVEVELVAERAVGADLAAADAGRELRDEVPVGFLQVAASRFWKAELVAPSWATSCVG